MYAYIKGTIIEKNNDFVVIENNGIGYNILMPSSLIAAMPDEGFDFKVYTYTCVREDAFELYGFITKDELDLFKKLISVSGIGPKGALSLLSAFSTDEIVVAIVNEDSKTLSKAQGIGKKTAERIIIDLKDKIGNYDISLTEAANINANNIKIIESGKVSETMSALISLGYKEKEAKEAINSAFAINPDLEKSDVNAILKLALKFL